MRLAQQQYRNQLPLQSVLNKPRMSRLVWTNRYNTASVILRVANTYYHVHLITVFLTTSMADVPRPGEVEGWFIYNSTDDWTLYKRYKCTTNFSWALLLISEKYGPTRARFPFPDTSTQASWASRLSTLGPVSQNFRNFSGLFRVP